MSAPAARLRHPGSCYRRGVRRSVAVFALLTLPWLWARAARADDPHDLFGVGKGGKAGKGGKPAAPPLADCDRAEPHTFGCVTSAEPLDDASPYGLVTWLPGVYLRRLPVANASHADVAGYGLGAGPVDVGPTFGGATGLENRWTIEGAPADSMRSGGVDTRVPLTFLEGITVTAGGFTARDRTSTGGTIDAQLVRGGRTHTLDATVWMGLTAASRRRPFANNTYFVRRLTADRGPELGASVVAAGPLGALLGGTAWYAAGVAPTLERTDFTWRAARLVDLDGDGAIDGLPGQVVLDPISVNTARTLDWTVPAMARAGLDRGPHHVELTLIGQGANTSRFVGNATLPASGIDRIDWAGDAIATWKGRWPQTRAQLQLAWHRSVHRESAHDPTAAALPQRLDAYIPTTLADDPAIAERCNDHTYPLITQCPVPFGYFATGGAGPLVDVVGDRPTATAEVRHRTGAHVLAAGATLEDARLVTTSRFTGGEQQRSLFDGHLDRLRFYRGVCEDEPQTRCDYAPDSELRYRTRYTAAYVEDTFQPAPDLRVDGGLRWELMWVGPNLHFSRELSPRLGLSWDVLGGGRSRVWTSMGRSYAMLPAGLGPTVIRRDATVHDASSFADTRERDPGTPYAIVPGLEPMAQDELTGGIELGLASAFRLTAWAQGRWLRRGLETTANGFDNPGRTGLADGSLPARRATQQLAVELATTPTGKLVLRAGYLYGRTTGNYLGAYDPRQGAVLYDGDAFNGSVVSSNEFGRLPTDAGHRVFVEADRRAKVGPVGLDVATRLTLASGRARNAFASTDIGVLSLIERGSVGRGPMLAQANVRVAAHYRGFDITLDVFNVFDRSQVTGVDDLYTQSTVRPIEGGSYQDLVFLKTVDGSDAGRRTAYGLPLGFQGPVSAMLGVHRAF